MSPAARRAAVERKIVNRAGIAKKIRDTKPAVRFRTSWFGENGIAMSGARKTPTRTTGIDRRTPAIRLWRRKWSASRGFFAPNARAMSAIVPAEIPIITGFTPFPSAAMSATPSRPTMTRSIVPARTSRRFAMMTGHARLRMDRRIWPASPERNPTAAPNPGPGINVVSPRGLCRGTNYDGPRSRLKRSSRAWKKRGKMRWKWRKKRMRRRKREQKMRQQ